MRTMRIIGFILALGMLVGVTPAARAAEPADAEPGAYDLTPPRLSLAEGQVSFWRPGADDWTTAQVNTPLVPGDEISPPAARRVAPPQAVRPEGSGQPAARLPGEPANRLAPNRAEPKSPQREQQ